MLMLMLMLMHVHVLVRPYDEPEYENQVNENAFGSAGKADVARLRNPPGTLRILANPATIIVYGVASTIDEFPNEISNMSRILCSAVCILTVLMAPPLMAQAPDTTAGDLAAKLQPLIDKHAGKVGIAVKHLERNESYEYNADVPMPTASLIKFPLMIAVYDAIERGQLHLDDQLELREEDKVPGSGILTSHFSAARNSRSAMPCD